MIKIPVEHDLDGWILYLTFDVQIKTLEVWVAIKTKGNGVSFELVNQSWNKKLYAGNNLELGFNVRYSDDKVYKPKIVFAELGTFKCNSSAVPITTATTTTGPAATVVTTAATTTGPTTTPVTTAATTTGPTTTPVKTATTTTGPTTTQQLTSSTTQPSGCSTAYNYNEVLKKSILFYEAQRSGKLPATNRIPWRKDSALNDGSDNKIDLAGGYYDAGDHVKFGFPMAYTITVLSWGLIQYKDAYKAAGQYNNALDSIKWGTDYFIKCHPSKYVFYGQVGDGNKDHAYWGRPEDMTMARPSYSITENSPGSELAAETAAALAAASIVFRGVDNTYASTLVQHASDLYEFADKKRGSYHDAIPNAQSFYRSWSGYNDELTWAAAWLYRATNQSQYITAAESHYNNFGMSRRPQEFAWDDKTAGVQVLMAQMTGNSVYKSHVKAFCDHIVDNQKKTPKGLVFISNWGANRHAANVAFICLLAADMDINSNKYRLFSRKQIHYMLGDSGRSYVVGFGNNPPQRPHHRSSSCPSTGTCDWNNYNNPGPNPQTLNGALVGGPDENDYYEDKRQDYVKNEVACDYNAGFQSAVAGLRYVALKGKLCS